MSKSVKEFQIDSAFKEKAMQWASAYEQFCFLNYTNNSQSYCHYPSFPCLLAVGARDIVSTNERVFDTLKNILDSSDCHYFGYIGYDVKNEIEKLKSNNPSSQNFQESFFFSPLYILEFKNDLVSITGENPDAVYEAIQAIQYKPVHEKQNLTIQHRVTKENYVSNVTTIKNHIVEGDVYELNYCIEFYAEEAELNATNIFLQLMEVSPAPFSVFFKNKDQYLLSASPERFLRKQGSKLIAQPMKGTAKRGQTKEQDQQLKEVLQHSEKEQAENMMIVDLMRNDLARSSRFGSVKVEELFGVYSLSTVHQMISTVTSELKPAVHLTEAIKNAFPMGSMTGAPKIRAMELIDSIESGKRGLFSGAFGYFTPEGNFDFNVLIRSLMYDADKKVLNFWAGSAITYDSDPEKEYEECLLKASSIMKVLGNSL